MISRRSFFGVLAAPFVAALALKRKPEAKPIIAHNGRFYPAEHVTRRLPFDPAELIVERDADGHVWVRYRNGVHAYLPPADLDAETPACLERYA